MIGYLRTLLLFYRRHLRVQPLRELMAMLGIAAGVALLFAVQVAHHSITSSFEEVARGVAGQASIELSARSSEGFGQQVAEQVERMRGVEAAAPILSTPIVAAGPRGRQALTLVGADERVRALHGRLSSTFEQIGERTRHGFLLLTEPTAKAIGVSTSGRSGRVTVLVDGRREEMSLAASVSASAIGPAAQAPIAAAPLPIVQAVAGLAGRVSRVLIVPRHGMAGLVDSELHARFGETLDVRPLSTEGKLLGSAAASESEVTLLFSVISIVAGVILAYNALLLASEERRRFVVYLIETGTPDSIVLASLVFDAVVLGAVGCLVGLAAGELISIFAYRSVPGYLAAAFPVGPQHVVTTQTVLIAIGGGMLAALVAALLPALAVLRGSTITQPEAVGQTLSVARRLQPSDAMIFFAGVVLVCVSALAATIWPASTVVALVGLAAGIVLCLPMLARGLLRLGRDAAHHSNDPAARLAVAQLRGAPTRAVALLATGVVAAFLMVVIGGSVANVQSAVRSGASDLLSGGSLWIKPGGPANVYTAEPFSAKRIERRLAALPVVASVQAWQDSFLDLPSRRVWVLGVPRAQRAQIVPSQLIEGSLARADRHLREGGWAALSETVANELHVRIGGRFTLPTPSGIASFRLAAITANYGWLSGAVVMNSAEHERLWGSTQPTQLAVRLSDGTAPLAGRQIVQSALPRGTAVSVQTVSQRRAEVSSALGSTLARLNDTTIVVLVTSIASVIALMIAAIWQSRGRFNSLVSIGMGVGQFARLIFYESGTMLLAGCSAGVGAGVAGQFMIDRWLQHTTGSPVVFSPALLLGLGTAAVAALVSMLASALAALRAASFQPSASFSTE